MHVIPGSKLYRCGTCKTEYYQTKLFCLNLGRAEQNPVFLMMGRRKALVGIIGAIIVLFSCGYVLRKLGQRQSASRPRLK